MKDKGKAVAVSSSSGNWFSEYYTSSDLPCKKHPSSSSVGICALCLKDRLIKLVCSDCGEQRLSSCSCSDDISSSNPSSCIVDIGSVGRISFLLENDKDGVCHSHSSVKTRSEATVLLKRSSSTSTSVTDVKKGGFWRFGRLFRKKKERDNEFFEKNVGGGDEIWGVENRGVSRSRSVCSFRGCFDDGEGSFVASIARPSDLSKDADSEKRNSGFSGAESFASGLKGVKKGGSFRGGDDPGFIDLKFGLSSESKPEFPSLKGANFLECATTGSRVSKDGGESLSFSYLREDGMFSNGSSCRITVNNNETKKCKKSFKVWKWIVKHHHSSTAGRPSWKKDEEHDFKF